MHNIEKFSSEIRLFFISDSIVCGVAIIIFLSFHNASLFFGSVAPVKRTISFSSMSVFSLNDFVCWSHKGFVGEHTKTFESGYLFSLSTVSIIAHAVFPRPVGRTTRVFFCLVVSNIFSWYVLGVKFLMFIII